MPRELERNFQISESVLRYLVVVNDGKLPPKREQRSATPAAGAQAAPVASAPVIKIADTATDEMVLTPEAPAQEQPAGESAPEQQ